MPAHSCLHEAHYKSDTKDLTRPEQVLIQRPVGSQDVIAGVIPAGHKHLHDVRQKASSPSAKAVPHSVDEGPNGGLHIYLEA